MEAECNDTRRIEPFEYNQLIWGDLIYGTKNELQAIGLGIGMAFPGEPGGPKRLLNVRDPRGFATKIVRRFNSSRYCASIRFPGRSWPEPRWVEVSPGLKKSEGPWGDEFIGTPEALAAAGLVRVDQLPGQPGMRKVRVTIFPDGSVAGGVPTANHREARMPGAKSIERASKTTYSVTVSIPEDERKKREYVYQRAERDYELRMQALQRPAPLKAPPRTVHHHAASVRCRTIETSKYGVMEACFFGPINETSFYHLRAAMFENTRKAPVLVIRMDKALVCFDGVPDIPNDVCSKQFPRTAVITGAEQRDLWCEYGKKMAEAGLLSLTFTQSQADTAYSWSEIMAAP